MTTETQQLPPGGEDVPRKKGTNKFAAMALIFPLFMALVLPAIYLTAFHDPQPQHMNVTVVAGSQQEQQKAQALQVKSGKAFDLDIIASKAEAKQRVASMDTNAAYVLKDNSAYVASAKSVLGAQTVQQYLGKIAGDDLKVHDLKPLPDQDRAGLSLMFIGIGSVLAGFIVATMTNMIGRLKLVPELLMYAGIGVVSAVVTTFVAYSFHGAFSDHIVPVALAAGAGAFVAALVQGGGYKIMGPVMIIPGILLFVFVGIPASGASIPVDMTPGFFQALHPFMPTTAVLEILRRVIYFGGAGVGKNIMILALWTLIAAGLYWLGTLMPKREDPSPMDGLLGAPGEEAEDNQGTKRPRSARHGAHHEPVDAELVTEGAL